MDSNFWYTVLGAALGVIATIWIIPFFFPPRLDISKKIAKILKDDGTYKYNIKVVNNSFFAVNNVSAELKFIYTEQNNLIDKTISIELVRSDLLSLPRRKIFDDGQFNNCYRFCIKKDEIDHIGNLLIDHIGQYPKLIFLITATHSRSGYVKPFRKEFTWVDGAENGFVRGDFLRGNTTNIQPAPNQN